jgi:hypothetical protein
VWAGLAILLGLPLAACGSETLTVQELHGDPRSTQLEVGVSTCNRDPWVDVEETGDEVRLTVHAEEATGTGTDDCQDGVDVTLEAPLGTRTVADTATDEALEVLPLEK